MARLVPFSLQRGQRIEIDGIAHRISRVVPSSPFIILARDESTEITVTRNELATLVVTERATFVDELDEPEPTVSRQFTDISHLSAQRMLDWHAKLFLVRAMVPYFGASPKSKTFCNAFKAAHDELASWYSSVGMDLGGGWSPWTLYHDMLRWRSNRFDISSLQVKGVEYRPWKTRNSLYKLASEIAIEIKLATPSLSASGVHRQTNKRLANLEKENREKSIEKGS